MVTLAVNQRQGHKRMCRPQIEQSGGDLHSTFTNTRTVFTSGQPNSPTTEITLGRVQKRDTFRPQLF